MLAPRNSGYALLLVLVALTLCTVALTGLATHAMQANVESLERMQGLQARWGRQSCSHALLRDAPALFEALEQQGPTAGRLEKRAFPVVLTETVSLGGQSFTVIVADEDAKLNINALQQLGRPGALTQALRRVVSPQHFRTFRDLSRTSNNRGLGSWGEVIDLQRLRELEGSDRGLAEMTRGLTLWGSGKLNIHRASDESLELICKAAVTDGLARRIVERHKESPTLETDLLLRQTVLNETDREQLARLLGDGSTTFSVWIECVAGNRRTQHLSILTMDQQGRQVSESFSMN